MDTNPLSYGLNPRIKLKELGTNQLGICKVVKSRIIQKDAIKIIDIARSIKQLNPEMKVSLICTRNICSKSLVLLSKESITILYEE